MNKTLLLTVSFLCMSIPLFGQEANDGDTIVSVPKKYVSAEGLQHQSKLYGPSQWVGIGKEVGLATREGLNAVVDTAEKFGSTKVGTFVMVMIAWKIMAREILGIVLGIPIFLFGVWCWFWAAKRMFFGYRVLRKVEGRTKFYEQADPYRFDSSDAKGVAGVFLYVTIAAWTIAAMIIIFG